MRSRIEGGASIDGIELPDQPTVGAALVAGAQENLTPIINWIPPFRAGFPKPFGASGPHGHKWVIGSHRLQPLVLPLRTFPRLLPMQELVIGRTAIVGLPFEVTLESGRRIVAAAQQAIGALADDATVAVDKVVVSSVANEYCGYVATAEEYTRQYYEGGHTLYGPNTQKFLAAHVAKLVTEVSSTNAELPVVSDTAPDRSWDLKVRRYLPSAEPRTIGRAAVDAPKFTAATADEDSFWEFRWRDAAPVHAGMARADGAGRADRRRRVDRRLEGRRCTATA